MGKKEEKEEGCVFADKKKRRLYVGKKKEEGGTPKLTKKSRRSRWSWVNSAGHRGDDKVTNPRKDTRSLFALYMTPSSVLLAVMLSADYTPVSLLATARRLEHGIKTWTKEPGGKRKSGGASHCLPIRFTPQLILLDSYRLFSIELPLSLLRGCWAMKKSK